MQAIQTRYLGPTNTRGSRIKATAYAGSITVDYDHSLRTEEAHAVAAVALARKLGWDGYLICGGLHDSYVFVFADKDAIMNSTYAVSRNDAEREELRQRHAARIEAILAR